MTKTNRVEKVEKVEKEIDKLTREYKEAVDKMLKAREAMNGAMYRYHLLLNEQQDNEGVQDV